MILLMKVRQTLFKPFIWDFAEGRRGSGFNSQYYIDKWEFTAKDQNRSLWMENYQEEASEVKGDSG